ncbi:MAG: NADH-quinone oxidoreductase subunit NuoG [Thiohalospira sp.]
MVNIEINGTPIEARDGQMLIEAADEAGINIPRFCYHKKLSVAANCRMCLVEVEKAAKPLPACATPVTDGMKVHTDSTKALSAQKGVMEFLLINHPLDCPICDQGGECDLQEMAMGYGKGVSRFTEGKRVVEDQDIGPLIATDMTRCIHCTRCVRFGQEIAGIRELGATGRGEHMEIGTYIEKSVDSELSGNVIDLCPVGALTSKPFRFNARPWELADHPTIAPHDGVGANITVETLRHEVMRVLPRENEAVNETWIADRERFSYTGLDHEDRVTRPLVRNADGELEAVDWNTALEAVASKLGGTLTEHGGEALTTLVSPSATLEEAFLAQKLTRGLGSGSVDHRLRQQDFSDDAQAPLYPGLGRPITEIERLDAALLVGAHPRKEQPLLGHRLRKAALEGAQVATLDTLVRDHNFPLAAELVDDPRQMAAHLAGIAAALLEQTGAAAPEGFAELVAGRTTTAEEQAIAGALASGERRQVLLGPTALNAPDAGRIRALAGLVARLAEARLGYLPTGGNTTGAWLAGAVPHRGPAGGQGRKGRNVAAATTEPGKAWLLVDVEPARDLADPAAARAALEAAEAVVAVGPFADELLRAHADILLPGSAYPETDGTFVNLEGRWQGFTAAVNGPGEARPTWKILRVLGNILNVAGFDYTTAEAIRDEVATLVGDSAPEPLPAWGAPADLAAQDNGLWRLGTVPLYAVDSLVRRAAPLQHTADARFDGVVLHPEEARRHGVAEGDRVRVTQGAGAVTVEVVVDPAVPEGCLWLPAGIPGTEGLGAAFGPADLAKN